MYHCIANYIDRNCSIYRDAQSLFPDDGRALFDYIWAKGERAFTARQQIRREAKWKDASISALSIPIDEDTPITWKEWCLTEGNRLGKTLLEIRDKYLEGFPASFDVVILAEKNSAANGGNGNFVRPANRGGRKTLTPVGFEPTPLARPAPKAGALDHSATVSGKKLKM